MDVLILVLLFITIIIGITIIVLFIRKKDVSLDTDTLKDAVRTSVQDIALSNEKLINSFATSTEKSISLISSNIKDNQDSYQKSTSVQIKQLQESLNAEQKTLRETVYAELRAIREDNEKRLLEIRGTVDEKLQQTLNTRITESFETVRKSLDSFQSEVVKLGSIASDVGDLKGVLSNVKTKGVLGELQLESILEEIIPSQYEKQIPTKTGSQDRVDFAVKIPNLSGEYQYLPIDSKFPTEKYHTLLDAINEGDKEAADRARKELLQQLKLEAKEIKRKYIDDKGNTVDFAVMFLPLEGLYVEAVNGGLIEELNKIRIMITGPSTMAAFLNSVRIMLQAVVIQKNSREIYKVFLSAKAEFDKFGEILDTMEKRLNLTKESLNELRTTRYDKINAQFKKAEKIDLLEEE